MRKKRSNTHWWLIAAVAALLAVVYLAGHIPKLSESDDTKPPAQSTQSRRVYTYDSSKYAGDPLETLATLQAERRLIDVHEHIESIEEAPRFLAVMDRLGFDKLMLMGSSKFTLTLDHRVGFVDHDWNNEQLMQIAERYPGRFEAWPTVDPLDPDKLEKFRTLVERGATGLKLYIGHGLVNKYGGQYVFHTTAMVCMSDTTTLAYVKPSPKLAPGFAEEFVAVLDRFPDMKVDCPHYMLSSNLDSRLREFLDTYPNLYSDIGVGDSFVKACVKRVSNNPEKFRDIFFTYPDRFMFCADLVVTRHAFKSEKWIADEFQTYLDMLTKETYTTPVAPGVELNGLALPGELLERILCLNYHDFVAKKPVGTKITREIDWSKMGKNALTGRKPGEALPPLPKKKGWLR